MFCGNCGSQIEDTAAFCQICGAKTGFESPVKTYQDTSIIINKPIKSKSPVILVRNVCLVVQAVLLILNFVFAMCKMFRVSVFWVNRSYTMFVDYTWLKVIMIVLYVVALLVLFIPSMIKLDLKGFESLLSVFVALIGCVILVIISLNIDTVVSDATFSLGKVRTTYALWCYVITSILILINSANIILISLKGKSKNNA